MDRSEPSIIVAAFEDHLAAARAINELHRANFHTDQFNLAEPGENPTDLFTELTKRGVPEEDAGYYTQQYNQGHPVVTLNVESNEIALLQHGKDILSRNGSYNASSRRVNATGSTSQPDDVEDRVIQQQPDQAQRLQLREEVLQTNKQFVQTGEIIVSKRLVTEEKTITVPVTREEITVEHRPRTPISETAENSGPEGIESDRIVELAEGEIIRIPLREEQINVTKTPVVTEEVILGKHIVQETRQVRETVMHEVPNIERQGDVNIQMPEENPQAR